MNTVNSFTLLLMLLKYNNSKHLFPMKKIIVISLLFLISFAAFSFDKGYEKAMATNIEALYKAKNEKSMLEIANKFERIGLAEKKEWLPWYYTAYTYTTMAAITQDNTVKDNYLDRAQSFIDKATALNDEESEIMALQGYVYMIRVTVDPATRGQEMAPKAIQILSKASQMNPENPRSWLLLGQMQYGTAKFMGTDTSEPCSSIARAMQVYEKNISDNSLMPAWGQEYAQAMHKQCAGQ